MRRLANELMLGMYLARMTVGAGVSRVVAITLVLTATVLGELIPALRDKWQFRPEKGSAWYRRSHR